MSETAPTRLQTGTIDAARAFLGERFTTNASLREHHSHGQDTQPPVMPDAVAFVETTEEAAKRCWRCATPNGSRSCPGEAAPHWRAM